MDALHKPCINPARRLKREIEAEDLLIWAYRDLRIDAAMRREGLLGAPKGYGSSSVWALGTRVDGGGVLGSGGLNEDAVRVHRSVCLLAELDADAAALLVTYARSGARPEWFGRDALGVVPLMARRRFAMLLDDNRRPVACLLKPKVDRELVEFTRRQWSSWWAGLTLIADDLRGALFAYEVARPGFPSEPWRYASRGTAAVIVEEAA